MGVNSGETRTIVCPVGQNLRVGRSAAVLYRRALTKPLEEGCVEVLGR